MKRRSFVKTSLQGTAVAAALPFVGPTTAEHLPKNAKQEWYELRVYSFANTTQQQLTESYFENAAIPALNRLGSKNIGVFKELKPGEKAKLYVLIPFSSPESAAASFGKLMKDNAHVQAGAAYLNATAADPAYERFESSLLQAFIQWPALVLPGTKPRIFELRRYESPTELAGKKKIEMFNDKGEITIFKRVGLDPVFFGETMVGALRPNLTYMLVFDDMAAHDKAWKSFGGDPDWKQLKTIPEYADARIVSHISSTFLVPCSYSQV